MSIRKNVYKPLLIVYIIGILVSIPFVPAMNSFLQSHLNGQHTILYYSLPLLFCAGLFIYILRRHNSKKKCIYLIVIAGIYCFFLKKQRFPAEAAHLTEYGVLAYLAYFTIDKKKYTPYLRYGYVLLLVLTIAMIDESLQYFQPGRVGELADVWLNIISGGIALALCGLVIE